MTCEECRAITSTRGPGDVTVAEAAATAKHLMVCKACEACLKPASANGPDESVMRLALNHMQDPEFVEVAFGKKGE